MFSTLLLLIRNLLADILLAYNFFGDSLRDAFDPYAVR